MSDDDLFDEDALDEDEEDELGLPSILSNISTADKRRLLEFKRSHNEREYEEELERLIVPLQRKRQLEELRMMMGQESAGTGRAATQAKPTAASRGRGGKSKVEEEGEDLSEEEEAKTRGKGKKTRAKAAPARRGRSAKKVESDEESESAAPSDEEEDEEEMDVDEEGDEEGEENDDKGESSAEDWHDSSDSDLFGSDEEAEISQRPVRPDAEGRGTKLLGRKRRQAVRSNKKRARGSDDDLSDDLRDEEDDDNDRDDSDEDGRDDELDGDGEHNLKHIKDAHRRASERGDTYKTPSSSRPKVFDSLDQLRSHLELQQGFQVAPQPDDHECAEYKDYLRVTLRRDELIKCLGEPFFDDFVRDAFVRVSLGQHNGATVYKLAQIIGVERNQRVDRLPATSFQASATTTTRLTVRIAGQVKDKQRISMLSNHTLSPREVDSYRAYLRAAKHPEPTKGQLRVIRAHQKRLSGHVYSHEEIQQMVAKKRGLNKAVVTEYSTAIESLLKKREEAKKEKDYDLLETVNKTIEALERENERQKDVYNKAFRRQVEVNRRMKDSNVKRDMVAGMRKRQEDQEAAAKGIVSNAISDPFIRRETRPKILWNTGRKKKAAASEAGAEAGEGGSLPGNGQGSAAAAGAATGSVAMASGAAGGKKARVAQARESEAWMLWNHIDMDVLRKKVASVIGRDPVEPLQVSKRERYLARTCAGLPPLGSDLREQLRGGNKSLAEYISLMNR